MSDMQECLQCSFYREGLCPRMLFDNVDDICRCLLDFKGIKGIKNGTAEYYLFKNNLKALLSCIGYKKGELPKVGDNAITLGGNLGVRLLTVTKVNDDDMTNTVYVKDDSGNEFLFSYDWYNSILVLEK